MIQKFYPRIVPPDNILENVIYLKTENTILQYKLRSKAY